MVTEDYDEKDSSIHMKCLIYNETKQKNIFTTGCMDFHRSSIVRHISSDGHQQAIQICLKRVEYSEGKEENAC